LRAPSAPVSSNASTVLRTVVSPRLRPAFGGPCRSLGAR
jgi:hypothetical protein